MQSADGFWLRERRALAANARVARPIADPSIIREWFPDAPLPKLEIDDVVTRGETVVKAKANNEQRFISGGSSSSSSRKPLVRDEEYQLSKKKVEELFESPEGKTLRLDVQKDPKALQRFLESLTASVPERLRDIARCTEEFLALLLVDVPLQVLPNQRRQQEDEEPNLGASERAYRHAIRLQEQAKDVLELTRPCHALAVRYNPFSCAVCKDIDNLLVCGSCRCARFCGQEHQRDFWPRHRSVCKFLSSSCTAAFYEEISTLPWSREGFPKVLDLWRTSMKREPETFEFEQLFSLPRCRICKKVPVSIVCDHCLCTGYCSEACKDLDEGHRKTWQCDQAARTLLLAKIMHKAGGACPFDVRQTEHSVPASVYENGWEDYVRWADVASGGEHFLNLPSTAQQTIIDALSFPVAVLEGLFRADVPIEILSAGRTHIQVHIFTHSGAAISDIQKYEEWLHRSHPSVQSMDLHFIGMQAPEDVSKDLNRHLCEKCREQDRDIKLHFHRCNVDEWIQKVSSEATEPTFRVAFAPVFSTSTLWQSALQRLAELHDGIPLVVTEETSEDVLEDKRIAKKCGLKALVGPRTSTFPSPLVIYDDDQTKEDNPVGLKISNMSLAVFEARKLSVKDAEEETESTSDDTSSDEDEGEEEAGGEEELDSEPEDVEDESTLRVEDFQLGDGVVFNRFERAVVSGLRCCGYVAGIEIRFPDNSRQHVLPSELRHLVKGGVRCVESAAGPATS